jgi:ribonucleotide reductase beta subunit family protein with ferritin-like domain
MSDNNNQEIILTADDSRFVVLPIKYPDIYDLYKRAVSCFWVEDEIGLDKDLNDWRNLGANERWFIIHILAFFAGADGLINENLSLRFYNEVQIPEARLFYGFQVAMEGIHQEVYAKLIDCYITDKEEKAKLFNAIQEFPCITKKADWCKKYIHSSDSFATRLVAFAIVEGVLFSGAFASIFWCKKRAILPALCFSNELISRDEALHTEFAVLLYKKLKYKLPQSRIHEIIKEAVDIEIEFICDALPCRLIGMNAGLMTEYIKFVADRLSLQLGYDKIYDAKQPFGYMETISLESKSNFFEKKVSEYALANKSGKTDDIFSFENADF